MIVAAILGTVVLPTVGGVFVGNRFWHINDKQIVKPWYKINNWKGCLLGGFAGFGAGIILMELTIMGSVLYIVHKEGSNNHLL